MAVSFDLFGTLVDADLPDDPASAIAAELSARDVAVPDDWAAAYREDHVEAPEGAVVPLMAHVGAALASRGVETPGNAARRAVVAAFDPAVETREGAVEAVAAAAERGPVAVLSNCAVPQLARKALIRSALDRETFDAVVTGVACGWAKPDPRAFETCADRLGVPVADLTHVGDDPATDAGIEDCGGEAVLLGDVSLADFPAWVAGRA
ncbi:HAD family hydrolase [Halorussus gelatinilyticus]|uniref:HAD family hydrolase n=1 Tax=Halorussus gelatinilyticus TaxID=2937524 RepID=A0A8U0ICX3_9EURY|nr:HAD family hydrolase [Halorussus gelatinilyticus]UPV98896.1 HAD family hydrolase [Halorussus gelatinilyticus]